MNVLFTVDVELWPRSWNLSRKEMIRAFRQYIDGRTSGGRFGLEYQLETLRRNGLRGVFFIEPLFASVMGSGALNEVVSMVRGHGQEIQLHIHPEWLGRSPRLEHLGMPRMSMSDLDESAQTEVIRLGRRWLEEAGAGVVSAFRAGSFGANVETLQALNRAGIFIDSSHNPACSRGPMIRDLGDAPVVLDGILEIPQTVYRDVLGRLRHAQIGSSSAGEIDSALRSAEQQGRKVFVILSHSAELLTGDRDRRDGIVVRRFERLCELLAEQASNWPTTGFGGLREMDVVTGNDFDTLRVGGWNTTCRYAEQALRRLA